MRWSVIGACALAGVSVMGCSSSTTTSPASRSTVARTLATVAVDPARELACQQEANTLQAALVSYQATNGTTHVPTVDELIAGAFLRATPPNYVIDAAGKVVPGPATDCRAVPAAP